MQSWVEDELLTVVVKDKGIPFDPTRFMEFPSEFSSKRREMGGYGLLLIKQLMDEVNYQYDEEKGTSRLSSREERSSPLSPPMVRDAS